LSEVLCALKVMSWHADTKIAGQILKIEDKKSEAQMGAMYLGRAKQGRVNQGRENF
jgi:hypothetical protein